MKNITHQSRDLSKFYLFIIRVALIFEDITQKFCFMYDFYILETKITQLSCNFLSPRNIYLDFSEL